MGETRDVTWTKEPPTVAGWYWWRPGSKHSPTTRHVASKPFFRGMFVRREPGALTIDTAEGVGGEWWPLPLHPPAETEQKP